MGQTKEIRGQDPAEAFPLWVSRCCHGPTARTLLGDVLVAAWSPPAPISPQCPMIWACHALLGLVWGGWMDIFSAGGVCQPSEALTPQSHALATLCSSLHAQLEILLENLLKISESQATLEQRELPQKQHLICNPSLPRALLKAALCYR